MRIIGIITIIAIMGVIERNQISYEGKKFPTKKKKISRKKRFSQASFSTINSKNFLQKLNPNLTSVLKVVHQSP